MTEKDTLSFVTAWLGQEGIMLSEMNPTETDKDCVVSLLCGIVKEKKKVRFTERVEK